MSLYTFKTNAQACIFCMNNKNNQVGWEDAEEERYFNAMSNDNFKEVTTVCKIPILIRKCDVHSTTHDSPKLEATNRPINMRMNK